MNTWILYVRKNGEWKKFGKVRRVTQEAALYFASQAVANLWPVRAEEEIEHDDYSPDGKRAYAQ